MWLLSKLIELRCCENILGGSSNSGIREMFVNHFGYVLSCQDEDYGTPREARPINLEIYKITEAYHEVGKLCDSGRSRRCIRPREVKLRGGSSTFMSGLDENSFMYEYKTRRYRCWLGSRSRKLETNRDSPVKFPRSRFPVHSSRIFL